MNDKSVVEQVEVNKKVECEKSLGEQLAIMEEYTRIHEKYSNGNIFCVTSISCPVFFYVSYDHLLVFNSLILRI